MMTDTHTQCDTVRDHDGLSCDNPSPRENVRRGQEAMARRRRSLG